MHARTIAGGLLLAVLAAAAPVLGADPADAVLAPYLRLQTALAEDRTDTIAADAQLLAKEAGTLGDAGAPMRTAAVELASADGLAAARDAFGRVSEALIAWVDATGAAVGADTARVYCPMVKKSWLQKGDGVRNPYFGTGMLGCGVVRKKG